MRKMVLIMFAFSASSSFAASPQECREKFDTPCTQELAPAKCLLPKEGAFEEISQYGNNQCIAKNRIRLKACLRGQTINESQITCERTNEREGIRPLHPKE
jgi:hypothetical protein